MCDKLFIMPQPPWIWVETPKAISSEMKVTEKL